jgi:hypothetical protein
MFIVLVPLEIARMNASAYSHIMKSKPVEKIEALSELVETLCKQVQGMTARQKDELRAELAEYYESPKPQPWLN